MNLFLKKSVSYGLSFLFCFQLLMTFRELRLPFLTSNAEAFALSSMFSIFHTFCPLHLHFPFTSEEESKPTSDLEWALLVKEIGISLSGWGSGLVQATGVVGSNSHQPLLLLGWGEAGLSAS